ncbi:hypothetical protein [Alkalihalobacterium sp. APHAB7]|uniref:hypothetical protein n=1 Tax=Alkalihalobacterium sp. APHAB7 TaxID=3402081 RepID=UPI003AAD85A5
MKNNNKRITVEPRTKDYGLEAKIDLEYTKDYGDGFAMEDVSDDDHSDLHVDPGPLKDRIGVQKRNL